VSFLDYKEQVIDLKLTKHGERVLARGRFKPAFYSFHDNDIIYDSNFAGIDEHQSAAEGRIQEDTVRTSTQYNFAGIDEILVKNQIILKGGSRAEKNAIIGNTVLHEQERFLEKMKMHHEQDSMDRYYSLLAPLGTSDHRKENIPAWNLHLLNDKGKINDATYFYTASNGTPIAIPQVNCEINYKINIENAPEELDDVTEYASMVSDMPTVVGGFMVNVEEDYLLLKIEEKNGIFENENFTIEVFEVEDLEIAENNTQTLNRLHFIDFKGLVQAAAADFSNFNFEPDPSFVEHWMNISVDNEIEPEVLYKNNEEKVKNIFADKFHNENRGYPEVKVRKDIYFDPNVNDDEACD